MTRKIGIVDKIELIYPPEKEFDKLPLEELEEKCGIVEKLGLQRSEAYYELWRRSGKSSVTAFKILIATKHYPTVEGELENKLRVQSMSVR